MAAASGLKNYSGPRGNVTPNTRTGDANISVPGLVP